MSEEREILDGVKRVLEAEIAAGRRHVLDAGLRARLDELGAPSPPVRPASTSPVAAPGAAPAAAPPALVLDERVARLADLAARAEACTRCGLHAGRNRIVVGVGRPGAHLMLVGEAPGAEEDQTGEPFVGRAGQLLNRILAAIGLERSEVYIANVIKCRPPENRNPAPAEIAACTPFLAEQIDLVRPRVLCALGRFAAMTLLGTQKTLGALRGQVHDHRGIPLVVTYHPSALLRYPSFKRPTWEDMQVVRDLLAGAGVGTGAGEAAGQAR